jgi:type VI protein secretion system component Hcp
MTLPGLRPLFGAVWLTLAMLLAPSGAAHAQGVFLDLGSALEGDSTVDGFEDWIVITSLGNEVTRASAGAKPQFSALTLTKRTDRVSPLLWRSAILGTHIAEARVVVVNDEGDALFELRAEDVVITGFSFGSAGGAGSEQITLTFAQLSFAYMPPDGGATIVTCWDVAGEMSC